MAAFKSREELIAAAKGLKEAIEKKHGKTVEELCREREKTVHDAIRLKAPGNMDCTNSPITVAKMECRQLFPPALPAGSIRHS